MSFFRVAANLRERQDSVQDSIALFQSEGIKNIEVSPHFREGEQTDENGVVLEPFDPGLSAGEAALGAPVEVPLASIQPGEMVRVIWRGKPVFIRHRTAKEIEEAKEVKIDDLRDPEARNANLPADAPATAAASRLLMRLRSSCSYCAPNSP